MSQNTELEISVIGLAAIIAIMAFCAILIIFAVKIAWGTEESECIKYSSPTLLKIESSDSGGCEWVVGMALTDKDWTLSHYQNVPSLHGSINSTGYEIWILTK